MLPMIYSSSKLSAMILLLFSLWTCWSPISSEDIEREFKEFLYHYNLIYVCSLNFIVGCKIQIFYSFILMCHAM